MKVDTARDIDYWVGIPLCALSSGLLWLLKIVGLGPKKRPLKKALFIELSEMGSAILVDPAMRKLQRDGGVELYFTIFKRNKASLDLLKTVPDKNIFTIRDESLFTLALDTFRFLLWTRSEGIDTVIDLELFSRVTALLTGFSGATRTVGFYAFHHEGLYRGRMLTHSVAYNPHIHISKNFLSLIYAAMSEKQELPFSKTFFSEKDTELATLSFSAAEQEQMVARVREQYPSFESKKQFLVLINPNASEFLPQRRWMPHYYVELIGQILRQNPATIVLITGAPAEFAGAEEIRQTVSDPRCINFAGKTKFRELPLLYQISAFMVTNDSGPAHFASVTRMPTYVLFGPETPKLYGALRNSTPITAELACSPCVAATNHRKTPCTDPVCLKVISPQMVFNTIRPRLDELKTSFSDERSQTL